MTLPLPFPWPREPGASPLVVAHRGASASAPENTIAAFRLAAEQGADGVELDVQLTRDGACVVLHDRTLRRTAGLRRRIASIDLERVAGLDCGSWYHASYSGERIPLLSDVLDLLRGRLFVNIEMKGVASAGDADALAGAVAAAVRATGTERSVLLSSFDHRIVAAARRLAPELARAVLLRPLDFGAPSRAARRVVASAVVMARSQLRADRVDDAHRHGLAVIVYTVDRERDIARCLRLGVDAIITNDPRTTRRAIEGSSRRN